ncbi:hypothetical protein [Mycobacterium sp. MFM001]|uniref:hypothetical protein n=1 Tax=Mycobacterium sp. MFM001 TaxID=2049453 RepID=UPI001158A93C|nr:hypothetical protein [Mycobacterium sp. MFM001]
MDWFEPLVRAVCAHPSVAVGIGISGAGLVLTTVSFVTGRRERREKRRDAIDAKRRDAREREINRARRFNELLVIVRETGDVSDLSRAIQEARIVARTPEPVRYVSDPTAGFSLSEPSVRYPIVDKDEERFAIEAAYFANPASPLPTSTSPAGGERSMPAGIPVEWYPEILAVLFTSLPDRYPQESQPRDFISTMTALTRLSTLVGAPTKRLTEFVVARADAGWIITHHDFAELVSASRQPEHYRVLQTSSATVDDVRYEGPNYLRALAGSHRSTKVDLLAGVCLDVLASRKSPPALTPTARYNLLLAYATVLHDGVLSDIGELTHSRRLYGTGGVACTSPHYAVALMLKALGMLAPRYSPDDGGGSSHLLVRILEVLPDVLRSFNAQPEGFGYDVGDDLAEGVGELRRKCRVPSLINPLVDAAQQFVPDLPSRPLLVKDRRLKAQEDERQAARAVRAFIAEWKESRTPRTKQSPTS